VVSTTVCIQEVLSSNTGPEASYSDHFFVIFPVSPGKCWDSTLKQSMTASFYNLSNSSFMIILSSDPIYPWQLKKFFTNYPKINQSIQTLEYECIKIPLYSTLTNNTTTYLLLHYVIITSNINKLRTEYFLSSCINQ